MEWCAVLSGAVSNLADSAAIYWPQLLIVCLAFALAWLSWRRPWRGPRTRYPIVLAHGLLGFGAIGPVRLKREYFRGVVSHLRALGLEVHHPDVPKVGSIEKRARALAAAIDQIPACKVNIVAHSMGGLDARYAISRLGVGKKVASLTTIGTPHCGTPLADRAIATIGERLGIKRLLLGVGVEAFFELTSMHLDTLNKELRNERGVRYSCVLASVPIDAPVIHPLLKLTFRYLSKCSGANDGMVPVSSQRWGHVLTAIEADHWAQIGWSDRFDATVVYENIARYLRAHRC